MGDEANSLHWRVPDDLLQGAKNYAVMILNGSSFCSHIDRLTAFWNKAKIRLAVDGGANYLPKRAEYKPDIISGDFDSIDKSTVEYFSGLGCEFISTPDQNETDFMKAIKIVHERNATNNLMLHYILVFSCVSGRPDHILSNFSTMYKMNNVVPIVLFDIGQSISWVLEGHKKHFIYPNREIHETRTVTWCSLVPLNGPAIVSTTGLRWNLDKDTLNFVGLVSSSNEFDTSRSRAVIETDNSILWTMQDHSHFNESIRSEQDAVN